MGLGGLEPPTSPLSGVRSNQLSYRPNGGRCDGGVLRKRSASTCLSASRTTGVVQSRRLFLRKEVIQPQVLLRLPCYDFTPVIDKSLDACLLTVSSASSAPVNSHGVTGGVYKARERIHRGVLIRDY